MSEVQLTPVLLYIYIYIYIYTLVYIKYLAVKTSKDRSADIFAAIDIYIVVY